MFNTNIRKAIICFIAVVVLSVFCIPGSVYATDVEDETNSDDELVVGVYNYDAIMPAADTYYLGRKYSGIYNYDVYRYYGDWYAIFNLDLSLPRYKGSTAMQLYQSMSKTYAAQTAYAFSSSVGGTAGLEIFELTKSITNTVSYSTTVSFGVEDGVTYILEVGDRTGYYKIGVCHDIYRHRVDKMHNSALVMSYDMPTPRGVAYSALLYSKESGSGYSKY